MAADSSGHVVISGTGRAGTSFLVRYLSACGLDVGDVEHIWSEPARAGLELPLDSPDPLPLVVKDVFLGHYCRDSPPRRTVRALVVPMRDLREAASSRVLQSRARMDEEELWRRRPGIDVSAVDPGGVVYSLNGLDQQRLLAVAFHELMWWATEQDIPVIMLAFPRLIDDGDYLVDRLHPLTSDYCTRDEALAAHARLAQPDAVRIRTASDPERPRDAAR